MSIWSPTMTRFRWMTLVLAPATVLLVHAGQAAMPIEPDDGTRSTVIREVKTFLGVYLDTLEGDDETAVARLYVQDTRFSWFTAGKRAYKTPADVLAGRAKIRASGVRFKTDVSGVEVVPLSDELATVRTEFSTKAIRGERTVFGFAGVITMLVERSDAGVWQVIEGHTSTPGGPPAPKD